MKNLNENGKFSMKKITKEAEFKATLFGQVIDTSEKFHPTEAMGG